MIKVAPESKAGQFFMHQLQGNPGLAKWPKLFKEKFQKEGYPAGWGNGRPDLAPEVIAYLLGEADVDVDVTCAKGHTAFTLAVENRLHDIAARLLQAKANVNHRIHDGTTALCFAIHYDDYDMVKLLLEYRADYRAHLANIGRPIYALDMSERIRKLIPYRV